MLKTNNNRKMKIGINASFLRKDNTGIGQVTRNFLKKLSELKTDNLEFVLYLEEAVETRFIASLSKNIKTRVLQPSCWKRDDLIRKIIWEKYLLPREVKKDGCDVFLSLYQCPTIIKNVRHTMLVHDIIPKIFPEYLDNTRKKIYWNLTENAIGMADKILAVSKSTEKDLIKHLGIGADKITVNYIDVDEMYKKKPTKEKIAKVLKKYRLKPGYILAGGGMEVRKNVKSVILAYQYLLEKNKKEYFVSEMPKLVIYGKLLPGLTLAFDAEKLLRELNLTRQVKLLDMVSQENMPALFNSAEMFSYPSFYEGFGMPPLEAMSQGTPTIVAKNSSLPEVCLDSALYCHADDVKDIAMVMKNILVNKELRETLSQRGKERAKKFSWGLFAKKVLNIVLEK